MKAVKSREIEALDLQLPAPLKSVPKTTVAVKKEAQNIPEAGGLDRQNVPRRGKLSKHRREAKSRGYKTRELPQTTTPPTFGSSARRLEIRVHSTQHAEEAKPVQHRTRAWGQSKSSRRTLSMPAVKQSNFVVVEEEVDSSDTPVCGIDLGPFLNWLSCMPVIPEAEPGDEEEEEEEDEIQEEAARN